MAPCIALGPCAARPGAGKPAAPRRTAGRPSSEGPTQPLRGLAPEAARRGVAASAARASAEPSETGPVRRKLPAELPPTAASSTPCLPRLGRKAGANAWVGCAAVQSGWAPSTTATRALAEGLAEGVPSAAGEGEQLDAELQMLGAKVEYADEGEEEGAGTRGGVTAQGGVSRLRPAPEPGSFWGEAGTPGGGPRSEIAGIPMFEWLSLAKPTRYLGNEFGAIHKPWDEARVRFCLTYPEVYEVGASNLGHILLYTVLNRQPGALCDRAYFVDPDMKACLAKYGLPLFAVESKQPLAAFDTLGFSLAYELGATNILEMLSLAGIPISWRERHAWEAQQHHHQHHHGQHHPEGAQDGGNDNGNDTVQREASSGHTPQTFPWSPGAGSSAREAYEDLKKDVGGSEGPWDVGTGRSLPLIFAGGPTATSNPEPFADFFDFFAIGDGEECLVEIAQCLEECKARGLTRLQTLVALATGVPGVYVPQLYQTLPGWGAAALPRLEGVPASVLRRVATPDPLDQIGLVPFTTTVHDRLTVEIRRGCTRGCRFCQPGMLTRPARDVEPQKVVEAVEQGMRKTGYTEFSLLSLSCSDYLALPSVGIQIKNKLKGEPISLSLPSQRVDRFNDDIANIVGGTRKGSLTFAPEAGTQRLRDIINKGLTDEELLRGVKAAWDRGWRQVKLYFMIGLPGETDEDVLGIARTVKWLQAECRRGRKSYLGIKLTISNFTPKPHTPFQWHSVSTEELQRKQRLLKGALSRLPGVKYYLGDVRLSAMEDFIGRGDRSIGPVIRRAWELGATNDAWWNNVDECHASWNAAIAEAGVGWKYRRVLDGEWDVMEHLGDARFRGQGGKGRVDTGEMRDGRLDAPLPWDIINTGIAKWWLKADLQRALEATTVPDCSHSGECSKCGVCSDEFGDNVVAEVPEIPPFDGDFAPDRTRGQRLRVRFAKLGSMVLIGHLDLTRLFDRALRRAALPVCYDNGIHSLPRLAAALPLPLGHSSSSELIDIELTSPIPTPQFQRRLQAQLPPEVALLEVWEEPVFRMDGKNEDSLAKLVHGVEYLLAVSIGAPPAQPQASLDGTEPNTTPVAAPVGADANGSESVDAGAAPPPPPGPSSGAPRVDTSLVAKWAEAVLSLGSFRVQSSSKRTGKFRIVDLRALLRELQVLPPSSPLPLAFSQSCPEVVSALRAQGQGVGEGHQVSQAGGTPQGAPGDAGVGGGEDGLGGGGEGAVVLLRYVGAHSGEGGSLRPEGVLAMLQEASGGAPLALLHAHRSALLLRPASRPQIDHALLRSVANDEAFRALYRRWDGTSRLQDEQPKDPLQHSLRAQQAATAARA